MYVLDEEGTPAHILRASQIIAIIATALLPPLRPAATVNAPNLAAVAGRREMPVGWLGTRHDAAAGFCPFGQLCEIDMASLSL